MRVGRAVLEFDFEQRNIPKIQAFCRLGTNREEYTHGDRPGLFLRRILKKQIEGSFVSDGKKIHVFSVYGSKSASYGDLGACIDHNSQVLLAQKLLSELARDPGSSKFKDLHQQTDDQQLEPMQKPFVGGAGGAGAGAHP